MTDQDPRDWMWSEALQMLARAERLQREVFNAPGLRRSVPAWEPPVDVLETEDAVLVLHGGVHLAARGVAGVRREQLAEGAVLRGEGGQGVQRGEHP